MNWTRSTLARLGRRTPSWLRRVLRTLLFAFAVFILMTAFFRAAAPFLIQTAMVRSGMERAIAQWTGHDVVIDGFSNIRFWPVPSIEVERITVSKNTSDGVRVLSRVAKLSAEFSLYQAIQGRAVFEDFRLLNPEIFVVRDRDGRLEWANDGQLSVATRSVEASGSQQSLDPTLDVRVGEIAVEDGRIELLDLSTNHTWRASGINGEISWPRLSAPATAQLAAQVRGETLQINLSSPQPLLLLAGNTAGFDGSIASAILTGRFTGSANLADYGFASGALELSAPDVPALAAWAGLQSAQIARVGQFSVRAQLLTTEQSLRLERMQLSVNGSAGSGGLELSMPPAGSPRIGGTLAFEQLHFDTMIEAMAAVPVEGVDVDPALLLDLDLRISGEEATAGPLILTDTAVSIMTRAEEARFDILDGTAAGGRITGQLVGGEDGFRSGGTARFDIRDADLAALWARFGLAGPLPIARGSIGLDISFSGPLAFDGLASVDGTFRVSSGPGVLPDANPKVIVQRIGAKNYSPLRNPKGEAFDYQRLELVARLADGLARLETAAIEGVDSKIVLSGIVSYRDGGLALSSEISDPSVDASPHRFFIGGTWPVPMAIAIP